MQLFSTKSNAVIFCVDWGSSGFSTSNPVQINLCLIDKIVDVFVSWMTKCLNIRSLRMMGHSFGGQVIGYIAQRLNSFGLLPLRIDGLDPGGPYALFGNGIGMRCNGIVNGCAAYVAVYHVDPGQLGTSDLTTGDSIFDFNPQCTVPPFGYFCQPNCGYCINATCSHYSINTVILKLVQNEMIIGTLISNGYVGPNVALTIYTNNAPGVYYVNTYGNQMCPYG